MGTNSSAVKPTLEFCAQQLSRLAAKRGGPTFNGSDDRDDFRVKTVVEALMLSEDEAHVVRIIDQLEKGSDFPTGYAIRQVAHDKRTRERQPSEACGRCRGLGWYQQPHEYMFGGQLVQTTKAGKCDCWREVEVVTA